MKTIAKFVKTLFASSLFIIGVVCIVGTGGDGGDNNDGNRSSLSRMDISGAKALVIASKNTAGSALIRAGENNPNKVYKLTEDGLMIEVTFYDESGNEVSSELYYPEYIEDINDDYIFMKFGNNIQPNHYIVNKRTGAAFQMENWITTYVDVLGQQNYFHSEASGDTFDGNAYYLSQNEPLFTFSLRQIKFNPERQKRCGAQYGESQRHRGLCGCRDRRRGSRQGAGGDLPGGRPGKRGDKTISRNPGNPC